MAGRHPILRWAAILLTALVIVGAGSWLGLRLSSAATSETAAGRVSLSVRPSLSGEVEGFIPLADWGVRADVFDVPIRVRAELESINRATLLRMVEGDTTLLSVTEDQLKGAAREAVIRAALWAAGTVLVLLALATVIWRSLSPRWSLLAAGVLITLLGYGALALKAREDLDQGALANATFFAKGEEITRILDLAEDPRFQSGYGSELSSIVRSIGAVLGEADLKVPGTTELYSGSDLHGNALVIGPVSRLVQNHPLLLAGDFGQRGGQAEASLLAPKIAAISPRVIAVSGNHDTHALMLRLARDGVTVLGQSGRLDHAGSYEPPPVIEVDGLRLAGYRDPLEYDGNRPNGPDRPVTVDDFPDPAMVAGRWHRRLLAWFRRLPERPDIVMIHQNELAQWLAQRLQKSGYRHPLTLVTGHDHRQHIDRYGETVVVDGGSIGAGGLFGAGRVSVGIARMRFTEPQGVGRDRPGSPGRAVRPTLSSVDLIAVEPFSGAARATRVIIGRMCPGEEACHVEPDPANPVPGQ